MFKPGLVMAFALALAATSASAQPATYYGPDGRVAGSVVTVGRVTSFYGPDGRFHGSAIRVGNGTTFHGPSGQYRVRATRAK